MKRLCLLFFLAVFAGRAAAAGPWISVGGSGPVGPDSDGWSEDARSFDVGNGAALRAGGTTAVSSGSVVLHDAETLPFFTAEAIAAAARAADAETFAANKSGKIVKKVGTKPKVVFVDYPLRSNGRIQPSPAAAL